MATINPDPVENLSYLALVIANDVRNAVCASFITSVADAWFHQYSKEEQAERFVSNPANHNITYSGLKALEEQSIVNVAECLNDEDDLHPIDAPIRRKDDLHKHRHAISHPMTVKWKKGMQSFAEAGRGGYDLRAALVWDLQRSINEELRKHGRATHNDFFAVTRDMAVALHSIIDPALSAAFPKPTVEMILKRLQEEAPTYQAFLEEHPDGHRDPEREKAAIERRQELREHWAQADVGAPAKQSSSE